MQNSFQEIMQTFLIMSGPLASFALIIWLVARWRTRRDIGAAQLYFHLASGAALLAMAIGAAGAAAVLLEAIPGRTDLTRSLGEILRQRLVVVLSLVIVATPLWVVHWGILQRRSLASERERNSTLRHAYLQVTLAAAAIVGLYLLAGAVRLAISLGLNPESGTAAAFLGALGKLGVTAAVWAYHLRVAREAPSTSEAADVLRRSRLYLVSGAGLAVLAVGVLGTLAPPLEFLFSRGQLLAGDAAGDAATREAWAAGAVVAGASAFWWHWRQVRGDRGTALRMVYLSIVAWAGGLGLLAGLGWTGYQLIRVGFGVRLGPGQWGFLSNALPSIAVAGAVFSAHRLLLATELGRASQIAAAGRRFGDYTLASLGFTLSIVGTANLIRLILDAVAAGYPELALEETWWRSELSAYLVLTLMGTPIWLAVWPKLEAAVSQAGAAERRRPLRRFYLYGALLALLVAALFNAVGVVRPGLALALGEPSTPRIWADLYGSASNLVILSSVFIYFARLVYFDRTAPSLEAVTAPRPTRRIAALAERGLIGALAELEATLGEKIERMGAIAGPAGAGEISGSRFEAVRRELEAVTTPNVLLVVRSGDIEVLPWESTELGDGPHSQSRGEAAENA